MRKNILITGQPKSGKSTLLKKVVAQITEKVGFVTHEILENNARVGFEIEASAGEKAILSHVNFTDGLRVGKYTVNEANMEALLPSIMSYKDSDLLYIDEIGQMQLTSENFKQLVIQFLDASNRCIMTITQVYSDEFVEMIKKRADCILVEITQQNREAQFEFIVWLLSKIEKAKRYASQPERFSINHNTATILTDHGKKSLKKMNNHRQCDCDFFAKYKICSHMIALEEYLKL